MQVDHFKFYRLRETEDELDVNFPIELKSRFDPVFVPATLDELLLFGTPVDKNEEGILSDDNHMTIYDFEDPDPEPIRTINFNNQFFEDGIMRIANAFGLMVPTQKLDPGDHDFPNGLDHYKLYRVIQGERVAKRVSLKDQFVSRNYFVGRPVILAVPCAKRHNGQVFEISHPNEFLTIYKIRNRNLNIPVKSKDQFGEWRFEVRRSKLLAVPSRVTSVSVGDNPNP